MNIRGGRPESVQQDSEAFISFGLALGISLSAMWDQVNVCSLYVKPTFTRIASDL